MDLYFNIVTSTSVASSLARTWSVMEDQLLISNFRLKSSYFYRFGVLRDLIKLANSLSKVAV